MDNRGRSNFKCVFVGNIPYDATEQQLIDIFQEVGPVVSFRLVIDRETGKTKGFGFCEYRDAETALSAMRNLNGYEMNGRALRVDYAENEKASIATGGPGTFQPPQQPQPDRPGEWWRNNQGNPPVALPIRDGPNRGFPADGTQHIANAVQGMPLPQIYDLMARMKTLVQSNPEHARQTLIANPQLATGLLHAQIVIGMIAPAVVQKIIAHATSKQQSVTGQQPQTQPMGSLVPPVQPTQQTQAPPIRAYPNAIPNNQPIVMGGPVGIGAAGGILANSGIEDGGGLGNLSMATADHTALLQQVINLTPQQIEILPAQTKQQIMQLKQYWMSQNMGNIGFNMPK